MPLLSAKRTFRNEFDFVHDYANVSFDEVPFLDADSVVFSHLAYLPFEETTTAGEAFPPQTIQQLCLHYLGHYDVSSANYCVSPDVALAMSLLTSRRYGPLLVDQFQCHFSDPEKTQFAALTVLLPDGSLAILYRGTDFSITGWKENFTLSCFAEIPGQQLSRAFLKEALTRHPSASFRTMGHSKGGNLADDSCCYLSQDEQKRLLAVYCLDAPGLTKEVFASAGHQAIQGKIIHLVPKEDAVGILFESEPVTYALETGTPDDYLNAHFLYNWKIEQGQLVKAKDRTARSKLLMAACRDFLDTYLKDSSLHLATVTAILNTLDRTGVHDARVVFDDPVSFLHVFMAASRQNKKEHVLIQACLRDLIACFQKNWGSYRKDLKAEKSPK
ncbi:MAG: DUF2974 domain-containing protein [Bacilli bacterium]|nr:DUF2974 domain-containing protein [Bacilli bacterium]